MVLIHAPVQPADPLANDSVLDLEEIREVRRPHVEALVRRAEQERQLSSSKVWVFECRRIAVKLFPVGLREEWLQLLEHRRARIRCQNLELRERRSQIGRVVDRGRNRVPVVLQETKDVGRTSSRRAERSPSCLRSRSTRTTRATPPGKLADAELHFTEAAGPLAGLKLIGFSI